MHCSFNDSVEIKLVIETGWVPKRAHKTAIARLPCAPSRSDSLAQHLCQIPLHSMSIVECLDPTAADCLAKLVSALCRRSAPSVPSFSFKFFQPLFLLQGSFWAAAPTSPCPGQFSALNWLAAFSQAQSRITHAVRQCRHAVCHLQREGNGKGSGSTLIGVSAS